MKNKVLSLAALWLLLAALVFVYTDRNEFAWTYEGEDAAAVVCSETEALRAQEAAENAMRRERDAAAERTRQGLWGADDPAPWAATRSGEDEAFGLNLMWGAYTVTVAYDAAQPFGFRMVSAGRQSFITDESVQVSADGGEAQVHFTLTDSAEQVRLSCTDPEIAGIRRVTVRKDGTDVFSRDLAAYAVLAGMVLTVLLVLSWDGSAAGQARRRDALVLVFAAVFASMPLLWPGIYDGHDLTFHLNRIEGIASGLRSGQFPVRIHASTLLGYGYASSVFYPELFLYIPAVLRNLGVSLTASLRVFEMGINLLAALSCYLCTKRIFDSRRIALGASVLYTLCVYRVVNLYTRATIGESLAMVFFPLLILALTEVLSRNEKCWPLLALAMTGIAMSHLLSTMFCAAFCALAALCCLPRLLREPRRIAAILKAAGITVLCVLWFFVPMLAYSADGVSTSVVLPADAFVHHLGSYLVSFSGNMAGVPEEAEDFAYTIGVVPGLVILMGCALVAVRRYAQGKGEKNRNDRISLFLLGMGALALLCATKAFPWAFVCSLSRPYSTFFMQMQFPWRLVGIAVPMLSMAAAWGYLKDEKHAVLGMTVIVALSVIFTGYTMQCFVQQTPVLTADGFCDTRVRQYEYTYFGTEKEALEPGHIDVVGADNFFVTAFEKQGTNLSFTLDMGPHGQYVEVPLLYYPGYRATADGVPCTVRRGTNNVLRIYGAKESTGVRFEVYYAEPTAWRAAEIVSLLGAVLLALSLKGMKKRARA